MNCRQYQVKHQAAMEQKNAKSEEKHKQIIAKAQADIENFYQERALKRDKAELLNKYAIQLFISFVCSCFCVCCRIT
jgi:hypothetical protein